MTLSQILDSIAPGDTVSFEANGLPRLYEGTVISRGDRSFTVRLDGTLRTAGFRFASIDGITVRRPARTEY